MLFDAKIAGDDHRARTPNQFLFRATVPTHNRPSTESYKHILRTLEDLADSPASFAHRLICGHTTIGWLA